MILAVLALHCPELRACYVVDAAEEHAPSDRPAARPEVLKWIAQQFALKFQHNTSQAAFTNQCRLWTEDCPFLSDEWRGQLPKSYAQALNWLEHAAASPLIAYDRCPDCEVVIYRCEFKDHTSCPRCGTARYKRGAGKDIPRARLYYNPVECYVRGLWSRPDMAR